MNDYFNARDSLEPVAREDLVSRIGDDLVTVLDVRPEDEFAMGHLPGARNIPLDELDRRLGEFPHGVVIVAYCRGPYCVFASRPLPHCARKASTPGGLRTAFPNGRPLG